MGRLALPLTLAALLTGGLLHGSGGTASGGERTVDFSREVRPILSDNCFPCHGPDEAERQMDLRLDTKQGAFGELVLGGFAIVPGKPEESELFVRISSEYEDERMPPSDTGKSLSPEQIETLRLWIANGAPWEEHWAYRTPTRPAPPEVSREGWPRNPIDRFILARLEEEALEPTAEADPATLLRRVTLDLTGLPPTPEEIDAFLADETPDAYEKLVDRLLASPRYGEHMARYWMDAARYADTHGFHIDAERSLWPWRDWVIRAFQENLPFDQFTVEQLAGDLIPDATLEQQVASGFHRNNPTTGEGGLIEEEYLVKYAVDRVDTTATVWLGTTMACAQCHDHKFDPVSQEEFYRFFAYFHNVAEEGTDRNALTPPPVLPVPDAEQSAEMEALAARLAASQEELKALETSLAGEQRLWEAEAAEQLRAMPGAAGFVPVEERWEIVEPLGALSRNGATVLELEDRSLLVNGARPRRDVHEIVGRTEATGWNAIRLEAMLDDSLPKGAAGRADNGNFVLGEIELEIAPASSPEDAKTVRFLRARASHSQEGYPVAFAIDGAGETGWAGDQHRDKAGRTAVFLAEEPFGFEGGTVLRFRLRYEFPFHAIGRFRLSVGMAADDPVTRPSLWTAWEMTQPYVGESFPAARDTAWAPEIPEEAESVTWSARPAFLDGKVHGLSDQDLAAVYLRRRVTVPVQRSLDLFLGSDDALKVWVDGEVVHEFREPRGAAADQDRVSVELGPGDHVVMLKVTDNLGAHAFFFRSEERVLGLPLALAEELLEPQGERSEEAAELLMDHYLREHSEDGRALHEGIAALEEQKEKLDGMIPRTLVMAEREEMRPSHLLIRGQYDHKGDPVSVGVPAVLPPLPADAPPNRLGLARWLTDPAHPLTARVTVNRFWQQLFGTGIVRTAEDFGSQGEWPSHPELLDWLAVEFVATGWDVKRLLKLLVTSATYRQDSRVAEELRRRDPGNQLLARGPRFRLDAEALRDQALAIGGLLVERVGGKSVKPYQPPGLWVEVAYGSEATAAKFVADQGDGLYRRSLYTFWKRTAPPPSLTILDAPGREHCVVRRSRTNTPLQALALMDDVQFVEAARGLAQRMLLEGGETARKRLRHGFRLATGRLPDAEEEELLLSIFHEQLHVYLDDPPSAEALLAVGDSPVPASLHPPELAAWTLVANLLLNLDEVLTKG